MPKLELHIGKGQDYCYEVVVCTIDPVLEDLDYYSWARAPDLVIDDGIDEGVGAPIMEYISAKQRGPDKVHSA